VERGPLGVGAKPTSPNVGKIVKVRWVKYYKEATNQVCVGEVVRETDLYLVMRGCVLNFEKGQTRVKCDKESVRWIPWSQIAAVTELPASMKWRDKEFYVDESGEVLFR